MAEKKFDCAKCRHGYHKRKSGVHNICGAGICYACKNMNWQYKCLSFQEGNIPAKKSRDVLLEILSLI